MRYLLLFSVFLAPCALFAEPEGPETRSTGGNFPGEMSCARAQCHNTEPNIGPGSIGIRIAGAPIHEYRYTPGETVPVTVEIMDETQKRWGFQITARREDGCVQAGDFQVAPGETKVQILTDAATPEGCEGSTIQFPEHSFPKAGGTGALFELLWTAPALGFGPVRFAAAGNAANGNNEETGDNIYTIEATVETDAEPGPPPEISAGGIVTANLLPTSTTVAPRAIATIFGENFTPEGVSAGQPNVSQNGIVGDKLASTCVVIDGLRQPLFAVFPTQINFQASHQLAPGPHEVRVVRRCDELGEQTSDPEVMQVANEAPQFFVRGSPLSPDGVNFIAAVDNSTGEVIPDDKAAAVAGETVVALFGTGFGRTDPPFAAGEIPGAAGPLDAGDVDVTIGGIGVGPDDLLYVGVAPCCAGLDQLVFRVPGNLGTGDQEVILTIDGVATGEGPYLPVVAP